jgi:hypothetical protein
MEGIDAADISVRWCAQADAYVLLTREAVKQRAAVV